MCARPSQYVRKVAELLEAQRERIVAVVGDLNIAPEAMDATEDYGKFFLAGGDGSGDWRGRLATLRELHRTMARKGDLVDAWRAQHAERVEYTAPGHKWNASTGAWSARVDLTLVPRRSLELADARIYGEIGARVKGANSDHVPVGVRVPLLE